MKSSSTLVLVGLAAALVAALSVPPNGPVGAQTASASASASAAAPPPPLRGADIPTEASKPPTPSEWKAARAVSIEGPVKPNCSFKLLREYLRVSCSEWVGVGLAAGDPTDVRVFVAGKFGWGSGASERTVPTALADVPLRRGQGHIVSFNDVDWGYESGTFGDAGHLIVSWRDGDADPIIAMVGPAD
jgi:hypothetical protein